MNQPNLPTDSLYKFCALAGIAVILISFFLVERLISELQGKVVNYVLEVRRAKIELTYLLKEQERLESLIENSKQVKNKKRRDSGDKFAIEYSNEEVKQSYLALRQARKMTELKNAEIEVARDENFRLIEKARHAWYVEIMAVSIGSILTVYGFLNWRRKIQVYQDAILKAQAEQFKPEK